MSLPARAREIQMIIRLTPEEKAAFATAAETVGMSLSAWTRAKLRGAAGLPT